MIILKKSRSPRTATSPLLYYLLLVFVVGVILLNNNNNVVYGFRPLQTPHHHHSAPVYRMMRKQDYLRTTPPTTTGLFMEKQNGGGDGDGGGIFGQFRKGISSFFEEEREQDFVKLEQYADAYGPGPLLVLYNVPMGVTNEEIYDMMEDGAPKAFAKGITLYRTQQLEGQDENVDPVLNKSMKEALEGMVTGSFSSPPASAPDYPDFTTTIGQPPNPIVVTFFSGFSNQEMLTAYNIMGSEIYQESQISPACAKAVPNAMEKPLRQVLEEIGSDHRDAMAALEQDQQQQ